MEYFTSVPFLYLVALFLHYVYSTARIQPRSLYREVMLMSIDDTTATASRDGTSPLNVRPRILSFLNSSLHPYGLTGVFDDNMHFSITTLGEADKGVNLPRQSSFLSKIWYTFCAVFREDTGPRKIASVEFPQNKSRGSLTVILLDDNYFDVLSRALNQYIVQAGFRFRSPVNVELVTDVQMRSVKT
jgi:hypothetical protein